MFAEKWSWSCKSIGRLNYVGREISGVARVWVLFFFLVLYILFYFAALPFYRRFVIFLNWDFPRRRQWSFAYVVNSNFLMSVFCRADE
jgi:hypothetical protein